MDNSVSIAFLGSGRGSFALHLAALVAHTERAGVRTEVVNVRGSDCISGRTKAARLALEQDTTHLFWLDDDMVFQPDTLLRLLASNVRCVAGNYVMRAFNEDGGTTPVSVVEYDLGRYLERLESPDAHQEGYVPAKPRLVPVHGTGMGCMLLQKDIFHDLEFPWFGHIWMRQFVATDERGAAIGIPTWSEWKPAHEDAYFCKRLREAGIPILVDQHVSAYLGHTGDLTYFHGGGYASL